MKKTSKIIGLVILGCVVMAFVDAVLQPGYLLKSLIKVIFFFILPLLFLKQEINFKQLFQFKHQSFIPSLLLGIGVYVLILSGYFLIQHFYDFGSITVILTGDVGVNKDNFIWVALYISICNSLLEEFFFRGFAFLNCVPLLGRKRSYLFSSIAFALYHVAMMLGWFNPFLFVLAILGLVIAGCLFNYLDEKQENIYHSWMVHMFANFAINTVGMMLFGII